MTLDPGIWRDIVRMVITTHVDAIDCGACLDQLGRFVEIHLIGRDLALAMPLVQEHVAHCGDCREEFEALLASLHAPSNTSG